jgi:hypothetical protein
LQSFLPRKGLQINVCATSAKIVVEMWTRRSNIFAPLFQAIFWSIGQVSRSMPFPAFFEDDCFIALAACPLGAPSSIFWRAVDEISV